MALSALSLACQESSQSVYALQHYQQAIGPLQKLQSKRDLASNGAFLTHFILLVYEVGFGSVWLFESTNSRQIAGTEDLWSSHLSTLRSIIGQRREILETEPFPYVTWWICQIDINALLSGSGNGELIDELARHEMVPTSTELRESPKLLDSGSMFPESWDTMSEAWDLHSQMSLHAATIGHSSRQMRKMAGRQPGTSPRRQAAERQQQAARLRERLKQSWESQMPRFLPNVAKLDALSGGVRDILEYVS